MAILCQQDAVFFGGAPGENPVRQLLVGDDRVVARRPQPLAEPAQHLVAQEPHSLPVSASAGAPGPRLQWRAGGKVCAVPLDRPASVSIISFGTKHERTAGMTRAAMRTQREAERRYPVRLRIAVPPEGFGRQLDIMHAWLDETCGAKGWATAPAGTTGVVNDALALYFEMPPLPMPLSLASAAAIGSRRLQA